MKSRYFTTKRYAIDFMANNMNCNYTEGQPSLQDDCVFSWIGKGVFYWGFCSFRLVNDVFKKSTVLRLDEDSN